MLTPYQKEVRSHTGTALTRPTPDSVGALSHHHPRDRAQMNKAADKMLSEQPSTHAGLVSFRGASVQLQPLIEACKVLVSEVKRVLLLGDAAAPGKPPTCPGSTSRGRRPGVGTHPATGRPGVGPGSGLIWAPRGPGATFTMSPRGFPTLPPPGASVMNT